MARKKDSPIGVGMTAKQMKRKRPINSDLLNKIEPITDNQKILFDNYKEGKNIFAYGAAGTGKTFVALSLALEDVLDKEVPYDKCVIVRSIVPTRDIGYLPGDEEEKKDAYTGPYRSICSELFQSADAWTKLKQAGTVQFMSTSFIRGMTISNAIVVPRMNDVLQNLIVSCCFRLPYNISKSASVGI